MLKSGKSSTIFVILAAGAGRRFKTTTAKQYQTLAGASVLEWTLNAALLHPLIDDVLVCIDSKQTMRSHVPKVLIDQVHWCIGGNHRHQSALKAIEFVSHNFPCCKRIVFHDAARALLRSSLITECIRALDHNVACVAGIGTTDTIGICDAQSNLTEVTERNLLVQIQTPQAFIMDVAVAMYANSKDQMPDSSSAFLDVFEGQKVSIIAGSADNIKLTLPQDLSIAQMIVLSSWREFLTPVSLKQKHILITKNRHSLPCENPHDLSQQLASRIIEHQGTQVQVTDPKSNACFFDHIMVQESLHSFHLMLQQDAAASIDSFMERLLPDGMLLFLIHTDLTHSDHSQYGLIKAQAQACFARIFKHARKQEKRINALFLKEHSKMKHPLSESETARIDTFLQLLSLRLSGQILDEN